MTSPSELQWKPFRAGATIGQIGSEAGAILRDEDYAELARITLEKPEPTKPFGQSIIRYAITCGIYDWMVHTRFFGSEEDAMQAYEQMKPELAMIAETIPEVLPTDPDLDAKIAKTAGKLTEFTNRFP
jgi:hypothetical protein